MFSVEDEEVKNALIRANNERDFVGSATFSTLSGAGAEGVIPLTAASGLVTATDCPIAVDSASVGISTIK